MKVLMTCAGGMSSSFIAKAIEKEGKLRNPEFTIEAIGEPRIKEYIKKQSYDIIIIAPQIRFVYKSVLNLVEGTDIKVMVIEGKYYTPLRVAGLLDEMEKVVNSN